MFFPRSILLLTSQLFLNCVAIKTSLLPYGSYSAYIWDISTFDGRSQGEKQSISKSLKVA